MTGNQLNNDQLIARIRELGPWHHDIRINNDVSSGKVFSPTGRLNVADNDGVTLISPSANFMERLKTIFPEGMQGKRFLDCACNAGGYCFWAVEAGFDSAFGFDVRGHWINQGNFVKQNRGDGLPSDQIELNELDLYDLPGKDVGEFDMTYFSGIFYHLPDPVTGLKIAADRTTDVLFLNTAMMPEVEDDESRPPGMTMVMEGTDKLMTGVHRLSWFPNNPQTLERMLRWLGFKDIVMTLNNKKAVPTCNFKGNSKEKKLQRRRVGFYAARTPGRLAGLREKFETPGEASEVSA